MTWKVVLTRAAKKQYDAYVVSSLYHKKVDRILDGLCKDPFAPGDHFKALCGELSGYFSRRIDSVNRVVYTVERKIVTVHVVAVWGHYEDP